jgi:hypothetical protein
VTVNGGVFLGGETVLVVDQSLVGVEPQSETGADIQGRDRVAVGLERHATAGTPGYSAADFYILGSERQGKQLGAFLFEELDGPAMGFTVERDPEQYNGSGMAVTGIVLGLKDLTGWVVAMAVIFPNTRIFERS